MFFSDLFCDFCDNVLNLYNAPVLLDKGPEI